MLLGSVFANRSAADVVACIASWRRVLLFTPLWADSAESVRTNMTPTLPVVVFVVACPEIPFNSVLPPSSMMLYVNSIPAASKRLIKLATLPATTLSN